jgi:transcriptional regulator with XRE-family HTH domain
MTHTPETLDLYARKKLVEQMRKVRTELGFTCADVGDDLGIGEVAYRRVESFTVTDPYLRTLQRYARGLDRAVRIRFAGEGIEPFNTPIPGHLPAVEADAQHRAGLAAALVAARKRLGLNQTQLGKRLGISFTGASAIECSDSSRTYTYQRYARAVGGRLTLNLVVARPVDEVAIELALTGFKRFESLTDPEKIVLFREFAVRAPIEVTAERLRVQVATAVKWREKALAA